MKTGPRVSAQTLLVLEFFLARSADWQYGYDISKATGLKSGTLYPILMRLAEHKLLEAEWQAPEPGRPPRHIYRITKTGRLFAQERMESRKLRVRQPLASGGKA